MKHIQFFFFFIVLFIASVNTYAQTPERVLSAEEFHQRIIEEKRQQLRREIQVRENDRMKILYDESIFMSIPYVKGLQFVNIKFKMMGDIVFALREKKQNELMIIFANTNDELNQMLLIQGKKTVNLLYYNYPSNSFSVKERYQISNTFFEKLVNAFNAFLAISPENREKVAQAIRDYRLAEYIKNELPDREAERRTLSSNNYRFIGFTIGFGPVAGYSDALYIWNPKGEDSGIVFSLDVEFKYINLYRINNSLQLGFSIELGYWTTFFINYLGSKVLFSLKSNRFLFEIGGYFFLKIATEKGTGYNVYYKPIDFGAILSLNYLLGKRLNYLLGIELRLNLNKSARKIDNSEIDEAGYLAFIVKFGYGF